MYGATYSIRRTSSYLMHYGVSGQKKGVRRYQNTDGSLTSEGKERYGVGEGRPKSKGSEYVNKSQGIKIKMEATGVYGDMKHKREMRRHLRDLSNMQKESAKAGGDKQYKSDVKQIRKDYKALSREYSHKKFDDINKKALHKRQLEIDERAVEAINDYFRRNKKGMRFV